MGPFSQQQQQWGSWSYPGFPDSFVSYTHANTQLPDTYTEGMDAYHNHLVHHHQMTRTTESKPRLSKEEVEILEAEFLKNHKPNSSTKKALAESMRVDHARINNWFQNRRAREKKENNIREYEARQRAEKEKADAETGRQESDRKRDLVASSAPFPELRMQEVKPESPEATSVSEASSDLQDILSPPMSTSRTTTQSLPPSQEDEEPFSSGEEEIKRERLSVDVQDCFPIPDTDLGLPGQGYLYDFNMDQSPSYLQQVSSGNQLRSPVAMDMGCRRQRRPAPLTISGSRSFSGVSRANGEISGSMRRVSSANGSGRVLKATSTIRSPFLQRQRSPVTCSSVAPPTPDTPLVQSMNANCSMPHATKYSSSALLPDLRTPPTTPGLVDNILSAGAAYNMPLHDDDMVGTGVGSLPTNFELSAPTTYIAGARGYSSQPVTPLFPPQMASGYFNIYTANNDCYWSDAATSEGSSPGLNMQQNQFMPL